MSSITYALQDLELILNSANKETTQYHFKNIPGSTKETGRLRDILVQEGYIYLKGSLKSSDVIVDEATYHLSEKGKKLYSIIDRDFDNIRERFNDKLTIQDINDIHDKDGIGVRIPDDLAQISIQKIPVEKLNPETPLSKQVPNPLHDKVLMWALSYREKHPDFTFWLRRNNNKNRLKSGFWFQGTESYAHMGLFREAGSLRSRSVGLIFLPAENGQIDVVFRVEYQKRTGTAMINFLEMIAQQAKLEKKGSSHYEKYLGISSSFSIVENFLDEHLESFYKELSDFGVEYTRISTSDFEERLNRTLEIRSKILSNSELDIEFDEEDESGNEEDELEEELKKDTYGSGNYRINYVSDQPNGDDLLEILPDVKAFASLIADKELLPPLAIALFGNWGSGKSFFMEKMNSEIQKLQNFASAAGSDSYCKHIVQIHFNAWHYSDTNLWASLIRTIFLALKEEGTKLDKKEEINRVLFEKISSSKQLLDIASEEVRKAEEKKESALEELKEKSNSLQEKTSLLLGLSSKYFIKEIQNQEEVKSEIEQLKNDWGLSEDQGVADIINDSKETIQRFKKALAISFKKWKTIVATICLFLILWLINRYANLEEFPTIVKSFFNIKVLPILLAISPIISQIGMQYQRISKTVSKILSFAEKFKTLKSSDWSNQKLELENEVQKARVKWSLATEQYEKDKKELDDIKSGKRLLEFINVRADTYEKELGFISKIRHDLESLQDEICIVDNDENDTFKIDRIVLYIDDLDRCPQRKVMEVLQAVHLLLAMDKLFVAVVGVDPRWISNAVNNEYKGLLDSNSEGGATSYDYLEKIFQIPFALKTITSKSSKTMVRELLKANSSSTVSDVNIEDSANVEDEPKSNQSEDRIDSPNVDNHRERKEVSDENYNINGLDISQSEKDFIEFISPIIGSTPRTIKRYLNIYRLIKSHPLIPKELSDNNNDLYVIIVVLAIVTAYPQLAPDFLKATKSTKANTLDGFITSLPISENGLSEEFIQDYKSIPFTSGKSRIDNLSYGLILESLEISSVRKYTEHISRFSFRSLASV